MTSLKCTRLAGLVTESPLFFDDGTGGTSSQIGESNEGTTKVQTMDETGEKMMR